MIVLDTHVWLWWMVAPERLSDGAREAIDRAESIGIPAVCCLELAMLETRRRIELLRPVGEWVRLALAYPRVAEIPITAEIALVAGGLDRAAFPGDPADRLIYASARNAGAALLSADQAIRAFDPAGVVW